MWAGDRRLSLVRLMDRRAWSESTRTSPRQIVGSLQQRLWTVRIQPPEDLIPDNTQQDGQKQTGSDAKGGGRRNSHSGPFTLAFIVPDHRSRNQPALVKPLESLMISTYRHRAASALGSDSSVKSTLKFRLLFSYTGTRVQPSANSAVRLHDPLQEMR